MMSAPINCTALLGHGEKFIFLWDDRHGSQAIQMAARWAENQDLAFTWYDAARIAHKIREANKQTIAELESRRWPV